MTCKTRTVITNRKTIRSFGTIHGTSCTIKQVAGLNVKMDSEDNGCILQINQKMPASAHIPSSPRYDVFRLQIQTSTHCMAFLITRVT